MMEIIVKGGVLHICDEGHVLGIVEIPEGKTADETIEMLKQVMEEGFYGRDSR